MSALSEILNLLLSGTAPEADVFDSEIYLQVLGKRVAESGVPKAKGKFTVISEENGNKVTVNVTEIGRLDCGHWNVDLGAQCCGECGGSTWCTWCVSSRKVGFNCVGCGRFICPGCARTSILDPELAVCRRCGPIGILTTLLKKRLCKGLLEE